MSRVMGNGPKLHISAEDTQFSLDLEWEPTLVRPDVYGVNYTVDLKGKRLFVLTLTEQVGGDYPWETKEVQHDFFMSPREARHLMKHIRHFIGDYSEND